MYLSYLRVALEIQKQKKCGKKKYSKEKKVKTRSELPETQSTEKMEKCA